MKTNKADSLIWIIFSGIGAVFLIIGIVLCIHIFNYKNTRNTTGTITEISASRNGDGEREYDVYVQYQADGREYESRLNYYSSGFYEGKEIEIYYDEENPHKIGVKSGDLLFLMFPGFGIVFFGIGVSGLLVKLNKKRREEKLKAQGRKIFANYIETVVNTSLFSQVFFLENQGFFQYIINKYLRRKNHRNGHFFVSGTKIVDLGYTK